MKDTEGFSCGGSEAEEVLDLTGSHLHDLADVELLSTLKVIFKRTSLVNPLVDQARL